MKERSWISGALAGIFLLCFLFAEGCTFVKTEEKDMVALDYTVVKEEDLPTELVRLIDEKKEQNFQMAYKSGEFLYLTRGYGQQMSGGYSIRVEDLKVGSGAIILKTSLLGPEETEKQSREPSYPYIVLKLQYREEPVKFE